MGSSKSKEQPPPQAETKQEQPKKKKEPKENYLASPLWRIPIYEFLDENCIVFDEEEENKFAYYDLHKDIIEAMIEQLMIDIGIEEDQLREVVEIGLKHQKHKKYFEQLLIVDNFLVFKKLMVKRNKELELEALRELEKFEGGAQDTGIQARIQQAEMDKERAELEHAIAMSIAIEQERQKLMDEEDLQLQEALRESAILEQQYSQIQQEQPQNVIGFEEQQQFVVSDEQQQQQPVDEVKVKEQEKLPALVPVQQQAVPAQEEVKEEVKKKITKKVTKKVTKKPEEQKAEVVAAQQKQAIQEEQQKQKAEAITQERQQLQEQINKLKKQQAVILTQSSEQSQGQEEQKVESLDDRKKRLQQQRELIRKKKQLEREAELKEYNDDPDIEIIRMQNSLSQKQIRKELILWLWIWQIAILQKFKNLFQSEFVQQQQQAQADHTKKEELRKKMELMKKIRENISND